MPERLPRTARPVDPVKSARDLVEVHLRLLVAAIQYSPQVDLITPMLRQFLGRAIGQLNEFARRAVGLRI